MLVFCMSIVDLFCLTATREDPQGISHTFLTKAFVLNHHKPMVLYQGGEGSVKATNGGQNKIWKLAFRSPLVALKSIFLEYFLYLSIYCRVPERWGLQQTTRAPDSDKTRGQGSFSPFTDGLN